MLHKLSDPLAQSYARTISVLLHQVEARVLHEGSTLHADNRDLRSVLESLCKSADAALRDDIEGVLERHVYDGSEYRDLPSLEREAGDLGEVLTRAIRQLPSARRAEIRAYLARHVERGALCVPTGQRMSAF